LRQFTGKGDTHPKKAYLIKTDLIKNYSAKILEHNKLQKPTN